MQGFLLDTSVLIEFLKGNKKVAEFIKKEQLITLDKKHFAPIKEVNVWVW